jgi:hypothetical protein
MSWLYFYFLAAIVLDHVHLVSPLGLAWSDGVYRQQMMNSPEKFILLPALCVFTAFMIGTSSQTTRDPAFQALATVYVCWNAWHFGSQHFGVASLLGWRSGPRWLRRGLLIGTTMALMLLPFVPGHPSSILLIVIGEVISFLHWTTDIGLTVRALRRCWLFLPIALIFGVVGFAFKTVTADPHVCGLLAACTAAWSIPTLISLRWGLGFAHFLYSRWVWRRDAPFIEKLRVAPAGLQRSLTGQC